MAFVLVALAPALGLHGLAITPSRPAVLPRCAAPVARDEFWVDFDDSGDECVISESGSTCMEADVAGPVRFDALDQERRTRAPGPNQNRKSPGMVNNFSDLSTNDFKRPFDAAKEEASAPEVPQADSAPLEVDALSAEFAKYDVEVSDNIPLDNVRDLDHDQKPQPGMSPGRAWPASLANRAGFTMSNEDFKKPFDARKEPAPVSRQAAPVQRRAAPVQRSRSVRRSPPARGPFELPEDRGFPYFSDGPLR